MRVGVVLASLALSACAPSVLFYGHSLDRRHAVRVVEVGAKQYVELDGVGEIGYRAVGIEALELSADGEHLAFPALTEHGWAIVRDGAKDKERWDGVGELVFSADGAHLAYAAARKHAWTIVQDGVIGPHFQAIQRGSLTYGACGKRFAYVAEDRHGWRAVIDGKKSAPFDAIHSLTFSGDGSRVAFVGVRRDHAMAVIDGVEGARGDEIARLRLGGAREAYLVRRGATWRAVSGGKESAVFDMIASLIVSPSGEHVAYAARRGKTWFVISDGESVAPFDRIGGMCFAGEALAFIAQRGDRWIASDGGEHAKIRALTCTRGAIAYVAEDGDGARAVIAGKEEPQHGTIASLSISDDGAHHVYSARDGVRISIVHDGQEVPLDRAVNIDLVLSPDGEHWASLIAATQEKKLWVVIDGERRTPFDLEELVARGMQKRELDHGAIRAWLAADLARP